MAQANRRCLHWISSRTYCITESATLWLRGATMVCVINNKGKESRYGLTRKSCQIGPIEGHPVRFPPQIIFGSSAIGYLSESRLEDLFSRNSSWLLSHRRWTFPLVRRSLLVARVGQECNQDCSLRTLNVCFFSHLLNLPLEALNLPSFCTSWWQILPTLRYPNRTVSMRSSRA